MVKAERPKERGAESLAASFRTLADKAGYVAPERAARLAAGEKRQEARAAQERAEVARRECGLFPKYATARFGDVAHAREQLDDAAFDRYVAVIDELKSLLESPGTIILRGHNGPGKTHLAAALINAFCDQGRSARYTTAADFFLGIKSTFGAQGHTQEEFVARHRRYALLVIDEVEVRSDSAWENNVLRSLVDARYMSLVSTVLITNKTAEEIKKYFSTAIQSRLQENGAVINCDWPSLRGRR